MTGDSRHERVDALFHGALRQPAGTRSAWVRGEEADASIVDEVLELLECDADAAGPLPASLAGVPSSQVLARLSSHSPRESRYRMVGELGSGAQGVVLRVWDEDLRRQLAMKVILGKESADDEGDTPAIDARTLSRFLEEAQITGQLDHPGIVPVHELGVDDQGRVYFTMRLVRGDTFAEVLRDLHDGESEWTPTRVLGLLLRVCEAVAFAHDRRVIHRDIKPSNLMVGRFGEVYVMDWGLGRVLEEPDTESAQLAGEPGAPPTHLGTFRTDEESEELLTLDGDILGTPAYMAPEQGLGELDRIGPQADVYSLGATLYHLLTGKMPYYEGRPQTAREVLTLLSKDAPRPVRELAPDAPPELLAICERAMTRSLATRYATVTDLADDLRAYLEGRVVKAYRTGPIPELRKWIHRHRGVAAAMAALVAVMVVSGFVVAFLQGERARVLDESLGRRNAAACLVELEASWPIHPTSALAMETWLESARSLVAKLPSCEKALEGLRSRHAGGARVPVTEEAPELIELAALRSRVGIYGPGIEAYRGVLLAESESPDPDADRLDELRQDIDIFAAGLSALRERENVLMALTTGLRDWRFADFALEREYGSLEAMVHALRIFEHPDLGIRIVEARLARARGLEAETIGAHERKWDRARTSIRDDCPVYDGLELTSQLGLVPLRRNPESGLWEFWHVLSGQEPVPNGPGYRIEPSTGVVLVLVPGGSFEMGAPESDDLSTKRERPVHTVTLEPYFLSRYELTQAQWQRLTSELPSEHYDMASISYSPRRRRTNPVESVSWTDCESVLAHWGLGLPTEAQWERAGRAGTTERYGASADFGSIAKDINFADLALAAVGFERSAAIEQDDQHVVHGTVDRFPPNLWGFHSMCGNVREWTRDWSSPLLGYDLDGIDPRTGEHGSGRRRWKAARGGGFRSSPKELRMSARQSVPPKSCVDDLGVRPARALD